MTAHFTRYIYRRGSRAAFAKLGMNDQSPEPSSDGGLSDVPHGGWFEEPGTINWGQQQTIDDLWDMNQNKEYWTSRASEPAAVNPVLKGVSQGTHTLTDENMQTDSSGVSDG